MKINIKSLNERIAFAAEYIRKFCCLTLVSVDAIKVMAKFMDNCRLYCGITLLYKNLMVIKICNAFDRIVDASIKCICQVLSVT